MLTVFFWTSLPRTRSFGTGKSNRIIITNENSLTNKKPADKSDAADKSRLETAVDETIKWFDASQEGLEEGI